MWAENRVFCPPRVGNLRCAALWSFLEIGISCIPYYFHYPWMYWLFSQSAILFIKRHKAVATTYDFDKASHPHVWWFWPLNLKNDHNMNWLTLLSTNDAVSQLFMFVCCLMLVGGPQCMNYVFLSSMTVNTAAQLVLQYVFKPSRTQEYVHTKVVYPAKENKDLQGELMFSQLHSIDQTVDAFSLTASAAVVWLATFFSHGAASNQYVKCNVSCSAQHHTVEHANRASCPPC